MDNQYKALRLSLKGQSHADDEQIDKAIDCFNKAVELAPEDHMINSFRGKFWEKQNEFSKAILDFEKCAELGDTGEESRRHLAKLKAKLTGDTEEVKRIETIEGYLSDGIKFFNYGDSQNRLETAAELLSKVLELDPTSGEAFYYRGMVNQKLDRVDLAIDDFSNAVKMNPKDAESYINRAEILLEEGDFQKALEDAKNGIKATDNGDVVSVCEEIIKKVEGLMASK